MLTKRQFCVFFQDGHSIEALVAHYALTLGWVDSAIRKYSVWPSIPPVATLPIVFSTRRPGDRTARTRPRKP